MMSDKDLILVRATVNLHGLSAGREVLVDRRLPWIKTALDNRSLVEVKPEPKKKVKR